MFFYFHAFGQVSQRKKIMSYFHTTKIQKYVLTCILALITSLLKSRELGQYLKKVKFFLF